MCRSMRREAALRENQGKPHQGPSCKVIPTNQVGAAAMPTCRGIADPAALCAKPLASVLVRA